MTDALTAARRRVGLTASEDWCAWLFEQGLSEPTSPADEAALVARLAADPPAMDWEAMYCMRVDESEVPRGMQDYSELELSEIVAGFPLRDRFNRLAAKAGLLPSAASKMYGVRTAEDLPRAIAELEGELGGAP